MSRTALPAVTSESVFDDAPHIYAYTMDLPVSADHVWAGLTAERPLRWCRALDARYTSDRPFGIGSTRIVTVHKALTLQEKFFIWNDDERHHAFYVERMTLPVFSMFAEDYRVTPTDDGCRFVWRFAFEARSPLRAPVALSQGATRRLLLDRLVSDTRRHFGTSRRPC